MLFRGYRSIARLLWAKPKRTARPSRWIRATYANSAGMRAYKAYIPPRDAGRKRPLVVMLHGCKQDPDDFAAGTRMNELADALGFIVAYPHQAARANGSRCWNWFRAQDQERGTGEPSLIAGITREVMAKYDADPARVYIAGLSAGGAMAAVMGCTYPELYAAVGVHSGLAYGAARDLPSAMAAMRGRPHELSPACGESPVAAVPTIVFHGDLDTTVHPGNGERVLAQIAPAPRTVEKGEAGGRTYTRTVQADRSGRLAFEHWLVHGAGHAWSGGNPAGSFADAKGPDATRAMLRFFAIA
jgi:poly(hydroxyalkanoate) depolymerase family esterase